MKVLYLSPGFPPNYWHFPVRLKELGAQVAGIGWQPWEQLRPELRSALTEYCQVQDMGNYDHVLRAAAFVVSRLGKLDRVIGQEEHWLDLEAALRLDFNVPGPKPEDIRHFRHKSLMKEVFRKAGVPVAAGRVAENVEDGKRAAREAGYPLIAKPDKGVGAHATYKLGSDAELEAFFRAKDPAVPYILEAFLPGRIESFDGLVDRDGRVVFWASHQFGTDIMTTVNSDEHLHYWSMRELPADLEALGRKSVAAFGLRERFFHIEFIRGPKGLTAMEINARPPGGLTTDMFNYANDLDVYREWARVITDNRFEGSARRPYHVSYISRKSSRRYAHAHEEVLSRFPGLIVHHTPIDSVFRRAIGDYAYLARSPRLEDLMAAAAFVHEPAP